MKAEILALLRENDKFVSGQELCNRFGVSRTAVWKVINQLKKEGYRIEAVQNKGYHMVSSPDLLSKYELESRMATAWLGKEIVYIPQNGYEFLNPSRTVRKHLYDSLVRIGVPAGRRDAVACEKFEQAGFPEPKSVMDKYPFQLSGGMAQRVTIALALCSRAKLLIADEPTNGLDEAAKAKFMNLLGTLFPEAGKLVITHDISVAAMCDRLLVLCRGRAMESGKATDVLTSPYHPYTKALLSALVENGMRQTPILRKELGLCPFYRRCTHATVQCQGALPKQEADGREWWCCMK